MFMPEFGGLAVRVGQEIEGCRPDKVVIRGPSSIPSGVMRRRLVRIAVVIRRWRFRSGVRFVCTVLICTVVGVIAERWWGAIAVRAILQLDWCVAPVFQPHAAVLAASVQSSTDAG